MASLRPTIDLEKELTCAICTDLLYQPLALLDCLHSFCGSCLKYWFSTRAQAAAETRTTPVFLCPACRAPVRDTKEDFRLNALLELFIAANPDKGKTEEQKEELAKEYKPGDRVIPRRARTRSPHGRSPAATAADRQQQQEEEEDRRLVEQVTELSLREAGITGPGVSGTRRRPRRQGGDEPSPRGGSRDPSREPRQRAGTGPGAAYRAENARRDERRHRRTASGPASADASLEVATHDLQHQSSLRSLIGSSSSDPQQRERDIQELVKLIQEEGLLEGQDVENIDLSSNEDLARQITEAYRRMHAQRRRQDASRRSNTSHRSHISDANLSDSGSRSGAENSLRPTSRRRGHSRSTSATGQNEDRSRPPLATSSAHLEVLTNDQERRRRRRTASTGRSATDPAQSRATSQPAHRSQTDLSLRTAVPPADALGVRPGMSDPRATSSPAVSQANSSSVVVSQATSSSAVSQATSSPVVSQASSWPVASQITSSPVVSQTSSWPAVSQVFELPGNTADASFASRAASAHTTLLSPTSSSQHAIQDGPAELPASRTPQPGGRPRPRSLVVVPGTEQATVGASGSSPRRSTSSQPPSPGLAQHHHHQQQQQQQQQRPRGVLYQEPSITCSRCARPHIEYDLHYNCDICAGGDWNICLDCYRAGKGCLHWFGFGYSAWARWERKRAAAAAAAASTSPSGQAPQELEKPHMLTANRYLRPRTTPGGADGRRTLTNDDPRRRMESGNFCARCLAWSNDCYWRCDTCNDGDWGFCNDCANQGLVCGHPLLPLTYMPTAAPTPEAGGSSGSSSTTQTLNQQSGPVLRQQRDLPRFAHLAPSNAGAVGSFRPLVFTTVCEVCHDTIPPTDDRFHCYSCVGGGASSSTTNPSASPSLVSDDRKPGQYEICRSCYAGLVTSSSATRISPENGPGGWRRCLQGHRMAVIGWRDMGPVNGMRRVVVADLVGGWSLRAETTSDPRLQRWYWFDESERRVARLVSANVADKVPMPDQAAVENSGTVVPAPFPPSGGFGRRAVALWAWYPRPGVEDELLFPRGAITSELSSAYGDWYYGTYMGVNKLVPVRYVRIIEDK